MNKEYYNIASEAIIYYLHEHYADQRRGLLTEEEIEMYEKANSFFEDKYYHSDTLDAMNETIEIFGKYRSQS